jgi:hypothetical protein
MRSGWGVCVWGGGGFKANAVNRRSGGGGRGGRAGLAFNVVVEGRDLVGALGSRHVHVTLGLHHQIYCEPPLFYIVPPHCSRPYVPLPPPSFAMHTTVPPLQLFVCVCVCVCVFVCVCVCVSYVYISHICAYMCITCVHIICVYMMTHHEYTHISSWQRLGNSQVCRGLAERANALVHQLQEEASAREGSEFDVTKVCAGVGVTSVSVT